MKDLMKWRKAYIVLLLVGNLLGILLNVFDGGSVIQSLSYFTIQSNILVFCFFLYLLFQKETSDFVENLKGGVLISIMITFIVYHTLLAPFFDYNPPFLNNFLVHTFTPLLVLLDYFLFDPKGKLEYKSIPFWLLVPIFYFIYANIYALLGGVFEYEDSVSRYPYFFMNPDSIGWLGVIFYVLGISVFVSLISTGYVYLDKLIVKEKIYK